MLLQSLRSTFPTFDTRQQQTNNIVYITFWSQFSSYAINTILILFLTRPVLTHGLGYSDTKAYAFLGVTQATNYLMPMLGGYMADNVIGIRRSILLGSIFLACAYLLVMLSGYSINAYGDYFFIAAYAFVPVTNSLIMGTSSSLVSHIYSDSAQKAKSAMTYYYIAINIGSLLAILIAPVLLESQYGPLSVLTIAFIGKSIAAFNFSRKYSLYDNAVWGRDQLPLSPKSKYKIATYMGTVYSLTLLAYSHIYIAGIVIGFGCALGISFFIYKTVKLKGIIKTKQLIAVLLIIEAVVFFVIYNQMNSTLIKFAMHHSNNIMFGFNVSPAHYQLLNPLLILLIGTQLPRLYKKLPGFSIPYQFAAGSLTAGTALLLLVFSIQLAGNGIINGNYIAFTYILITIAELWVSAIGLSMIGLYCDNKAIAFAMGVWYLTHALSNSISGRLASWVAVPQNSFQINENLIYFKHYYFTIGLTALTLGLFMWSGAMILQKRCAKKGIVLD